MSGSITFYFWFSFRLFEASFFNHFRSVGVEDETRATSSSLLAQPQLIFSRLNPVFQPPPNPTFIPCSLVLTWSITSTQDLVLSILPPLTHKWSIVFPVHFFPSHHHVLICPPFWAPTPLYCTSLTCNKLILIWWKLTITLINFLPYICILS